MSGITKDSTGSPASPTLHRHTLACLHRGDRQHHLSSATRWQYFTSDDQSDYAGHQTGWPREVANQRTTTRSSEGNRDSIWPTGNEAREPLSDGSEDSDTVFFEQLPAGSHRRDKRVNTSPCRRQTSRHDPPESDSRGLHHRGKCRDGEGDQGQWEEEYEHRDDPKERRARRPECRRRRRDEFEGWHRDGDYDRDSRSREGMERQSSLGNPIGLQDRDGRRDKDLSRTWTYRENPNKHVHFQDDGWRYEGLRSDSSQVWEMLGQVLRERGVAVRHATHGAPLQTRPQRRGSQMQPESESSCDGSQLHPRAFQRFAATRHSYHGDVRERRRLSHRENREKSFGEDLPEERLSESLVIEEAHGAEVDEEPSRDSDLANRRERRRSRRWSRGVFGHKDEERQEDGRSHQDGRVMRSASERWRCHKEIEERPSSEECKVRRHHLRAPQSSQSLSSSGGGGEASAGSRHTPAGRTCQPQSRRACLDLGDLHQVLEDEELARRLQEEEDQLLRRSPQPCSSSRRSNPEGDFRVAQVAQDEEIARFMQKQEIKSKRRSRELEGPASWREHREMMEHHRAGRHTTERRVQRERLDSEGLPSPIEDYSAENQPPSPVSTLPQTQQIRNVAEELDPTFKVKRQDKESLREGLTGPACQSLPVGQSGLRDLLEEPAFIPPTKRQSDKSGRSKPKEKKENCKQQ
ncbi:coiled-coil domain-containing protein 187 isoform X2 [Lampris incognitus]|uniref:coiled-coil domain-containing protein 187 isoform X2 n=1 Tax=Lampris incognitus TaxID=2546036 RepID=UPI0024B5A0BE|nr:coiled-coil domain-containing protein 187 isoform X2 [Lampris incognitus]